VDEIKIVSEGFMFIDSEGQKSLKPEQLDEISEIGYFLRVQIDRGVYTTYAPVDVQTYFDNEGAARARARERCLKRLKGFADGKRDSAKDSKG